MLNLNRLYVSERFEYILRRNVACIFLVSFLYPYFRIFLLLLLKELRYIKSLYAKVPVIKEFFMNNFSTASIQQISPFLIKYILNMHTLMVTELLSCRDFFSVVRGRKRMKRMEYFFLSKQIFLTIHFASFINLVNYLFYLVFKFVFNLSLIRSTSFFRMLLLC